ncbi:bifunctional cobalt-precorrin-7 (C(5))-methyltransferase/cobalt-precorrin-6B (C(15))-methyltransferase [Streptomyces sp. NPDC048577]|uniref:bifunctional cobalt-precorrin-7 (C(5))-methyltransferase/cobalt-precorrin-6B (C(15))-methyltransferase n=1 Tax=Streptomyces sp. NPDC048577 TaxID=3157209 RepID=UPI00342410B6
MFTVTGSGADADAGGGGSWTSEATPVAEARAEAPGAPESVPAGGRLFVRAPAARRGAGAVGLAFARPRPAWDDAVVVDGAVAWDGPALDRAVNVCRVHPKVAVLPGPGVGPAELGAALVHRVDSRTLVVFSALGDPFRERFERVTPHEAMCRVWEAVDLVLCLDESRPQRHAPAVSGPLTGPGHWALPDTEFLPGATAGARSGEGSRAGSGFPRTGRNTGEGDAPAVAPPLPYEARALVLARLGPRTGDLVWDIGSGCGSVAVECARLGAGAVAVEETDAGAARIRGHAAALGAEVRVVRGAAPTVLSHLSDPDGVFVGDGCRDPRTVVLTAARRARRAVVVAAAARERLTPLRSALESSGFSVGGVLLRSQRLLPDDASSAAPVAPVFLLWGTR